MLNCDFIYLQGFDEFMNVVLDDAAEVFVKDAKPRRELGEHDS
jgi:small nuclear ribonucleoprotein (snRNP)-like protein